MPMSYASLLAPWGIDRKMVDLDMRIGRLEVGFKNAKDAGNGNWNAGVGCFGTETPPICSLT